MRHRGVAMGSGGGIHLGLSPMARPKKAEKTGSTANIGFEAKLWESACKLRIDMDAAEYKHVVLGLIFLKYISDSFEEQRKKLEAEKGADPEDKDEYLAGNVFWVPKAARWPHIQAQARQATIGKVIDDAMLAIEKDNSRLKGILPKEFGSSDLDKGKLGELVDLVGSIGLGDDESRSKDVLGRVYEYFLGKFASAEGKNSGQFYTPSCVVKTLVGMISPFKGRIYDPCCGSGGMFVQSERFIEEHGGKIGDISVYGQESNPTTRRLAAMNLAIRGIEADLGPKHEDTFRDTLHPDLKADYVLANPPFGIKEWSRRVDDVRWKYGIPPAGSSDYAWIQHFIHHLAPNGFAGFVMSNGSMTSGQSGEGEMRQAILEGDLVDCMVTLPGQLFYSTQIPVCLWFLARNKADGRRRSRKGETLFIDARKMGTMVDRVHRELTDADIAKIVGAYHAWRGDKGAAKYEDVAGFCKGSNLEEIKKHGYVLTPGRYVGSEDIEEDGEPFEIKMPRLTSSLNSQFAESERLQNSIRDNLKTLGYGK